MERYTFMFVTCVMCVYCVHYNYRIQPSMKRILIFVVSIGPNETIIHTRGGLEREKIGKDIFGREK